jgi:hypothetical protein
VRSIFVIAVSIGVSGCSIHPLPNDVTRDTTLSIVQKIRCEARDAIRTQLSVLLLESSSPPTQAIGRELAAEARDLDQIYVRDIDPASLARMKRFYQVGIGYSFEFTIEESNLGSGSSTFTFPFTGGTFSVGVQAGEDRARRNIRTFTIIDTVKELAESTFCHLGEPVAENYKYPITGTIGINEMFATFYGLVRDTRKLDASGKSPAFSDQLTFTTRIAGTVNPKVVLAPVVKDLRLTDASVNLGAERRDQHQVIVAIKLPDKFDQLGLKKSIADEIQNLRVLDAYRSRDRL